MHRRFTPVTPRLLARASLAALVLCSSACDSDESLEPDADARVEPAPIDANDLLAEPDPAEAVDREPDLVLTLDAGSRVGFMLEDDGSIGVLEEVHAGVTSVLADPRLSEASPAVIWYALTEQGEAIPEALRVHHEGLAAIGELPPLEHALADQIRDIAPIPLADETSPCWNPTFDAAHCDHPDYQDSLCYFNTGGSLTWNVSEAYRYKAGFCLQAGEARSWLYYWPGSGPIDGECVYFRTPHFVWGAGSYANGDRYAATTYFYYVWWMPAGGARRAFFHRAIGDAGAVFDFGNRYSTGGC